MLIKLELTNFKKHENLTVDFTAGLNVFRAANEAGKSSVYDAIAYAFWGSRALPESLEETVTWGKPAATLRVALKFSIAGVEYKIVRSKSGAELTGGKLVVSGQSEVTAHVERLTGASFNIGRMTLLSSQNGLQASLDSSAMSLIEKLSNMGLIDTLVTAVQTNLPSGNTKLLEQQLVGMQELVLPVADFSTQISDIAAASISIENAAAAHSEALAKLEELRLVSEPAAKRLADAQAQEKQVRSAELRLQQAQRSVQFPVDEYVGPSIEELEALRDKQKSDRRVLSAFQLVQSLPTVELHATAEEAKKSLDAWNSSLSEARALDKHLAVKAAQIKASAITDESCALCGKFLSDVPEVVEVNSKVSIELAKIAEQQQTVAADIVSLSEKIPKLQATLYNHDKFLRIAAQIPEEFVSYDKTKTPWAFSWLGQIPGPVDSTNYDKLISSRKDQIASFEHLLALANAAAEQVAMIQAELKDLRVSPALDGDEEAVLTTVSFAPQIGILQNKLVKAQAGLETAKQALAHAQELHQSRVTAYETAVAQRDRLSETLLSYNKNNAIIKKLREARPIVARELWNLVANGVSHTFSQIRGVPSKVSRSDDRFLIDGKSSSAYSGSTKDALGLAIRIVSQKTFLPNIGFMLFDEAAAGADDVRETAMIATLASSGFPQVILVTHSELADAFASNLIVF